MIFPRNEDSSIKYLGTRNQNNKKQLFDFNEGRIIFEYTIPRMGKRVDAVFLYHNIVFLLEFKCGDDEYRSTTYDQVYDYALDLRNFQKESHNKLLVSIMISTKAPALNTHDIYLITLRISRSLRLSLSKLTITALTFSLCRCLRWYEDPLSNMMKSDPHFFLIM